MPCPAAGWRWVGSLLIAALASAHAQSLHVPPAAPSPSTAATTAPATAAVPSTGPAPAGNAAANPAGTWRAANDAVGAFPRGHADILRWEQAQGLESRSASAPKADVWSLDEVVRRALLARPDLLITPGLGMRERLRLEQTAAAVVRDAQAVWIEAVAARQIRRLAQDAHSAADAGAELARRMQQVGNFSAQRQWRETLPLWEAEARVEQALAAEQQAMVRLWQQIGGSESPEALARHLPDTLPARPILPSADAQATWVAQVRQRHPDWHRLQLDAQRQRAALPPGAWHELQAAWAQAVARGLPSAPRWDPTAPRWPHTWEQALAAHAALTQLERRLDGDLELAWAGARRAAEQAQRLGERVLPTLQQLEEDTLLRYNGMLVSTWELLAAARERLATQQAVIAAERDAWLAWLDLQAVLAGLPLRERAVSAPANAPATPAQGH